MFPKRHELLINLLASTRLNYLTLVIHDRHFQSELCAMQLDAYWQWVALQGATSSDEAPHQDDCQSPQTPHFD